VLSAPVQETAASAMIDDDVSELAAEPQHNPGRLRTSTPALLLVGYTSIRVQTTNPCIIFL